MWGSNKTIKNHGCHVPSTFSRPDTIHSTLEASPFLLPTVLGVGAINSHHHVKKWCNMSKDTELEWKGVGRRGQELPDLCGFSSFPWRGPCHPSTEETEASVPRKHRGCLEIVPHQLVTSPPGNFSSPIPPGEPGR